MRPVDVRARIAWAVFGLTTLAVVLDTAFTAAHQPLLSEATWADHGWPLIPLSGAGCALMGALVVSRYPRQPLGWLLCAASLISVTLAAEAYGAWVLEGDGPGSPHWAHVSGWVGSLLGWPAFTAIIIIFLISPDGRLPSPRWRWAVGVTLVGLALHTLGTLTIRPGEFVYGEQYGTRSLSAPLLVIGVALVAAGLIAAAISLVLRLRRARDDARRQLLWIASSAAFLAFGVVFVLAVPSVQGHEASWLAALPLHIAQLVFPLCVAVAVLRHRLLQIDLIVNRAVVVALATSMVAVGYVVVVVVVGLAVGGGVGAGAGEFWPSLLATALVAMAFQPLRLRVVRVADRLAFGAAAAPYEALADFSRRLGDRPGPSTLLPAAAEAAAHALSAQQATAVLHVEDGPDRRAVWPPLGGDSPDGSKVEAPVVDRGERLGSLMVVMPAGRRLRDRELRLLTDLADQAGTAFRNARLTAELYARVEQLEDRTSELVESRRRLITAADAEGARLERSLARDVVPHLTPLPRRLRSLASAGGDGANTSDGDLDVVLLRQLVNEVGAALQSLREITRGVFPAQLTRSGLPTALRSHLSRSAGPVVLTIDESVTGRRFEPRVEAAAYFCVTEATRSRGHRIEVTLTVVEPELVLIVSGRDLACLGTAHVRDRVEAAGGSVASHPVERGTAAAGQTIVQVRLPTPCKGQSGPGYASGRSTAVDQTAESRSGPNADLVT